MKHIDEISEYLLQRRKSQDISQKGMRMKIGMTQQQYQRIEKGADTKVSTLIRILEGLDTEMVLVPSERLSVVSLLLNASPEQFESLAQLIEDAGQYSKWAQWEADNYKGDETEHLWDLHVFKPEKSKGDK